MPSSASSPPEWSVRQAGYNQTGVSYTTGNYGSRLGRAYLRARSELLEREIDARFGSSSDLDVLEIGCGTGLTLDELAHNPKRHLFGLDFSSTMLGEASTRARTATNPPTLLLGNAVELPFADASFDVVYATRFIHQFPHADKLRIAKEIARVLRPGGLAALEFYARALNRLRYYTTQRHKYATRDAYFSHYPSPGEIREIAGTAYEIHALRYLGDRLVNRVLGYRFFCLGESVVTRLAPARSLMSEHWVFYAPHGDREKWLPSQREVHPEPLAKLRCPSCRGSLSREHESTILACSACHRAYAVENGVPNLLSHEARELTPPAPRALLKPGTAE
jgi:ubiquinone/menaquinone biosynthesis C-methylase UbiE/uncharacterized protein YbaR (Trm112 family)